MIARGTWIWLVILLASGFGLFGLKYRVQALEHKLAETNRQILADEQAIHVLKAEWSYLNEPARLDRLARQYLGLVPLDGKQFATVEQLPFRPDSAPNLDASGADAPAATAPLAKFGVPMPEHPPVLLPRDRARGRVTLAREVQ